MKQLEDYIRDIYLFILTLQPTNLCRFLLQVTCTAQPRSIIGGQRLGKEKGQKKK
jgi:hypothetical protein